MAEPGLEFAGLLRRLRATTRLTQEELAEAAGISPRSVSDLERGINRTARKDTALLLADALSLTGQPRVLFVAAARGRAPAGEVLTALSQDTGPDQDAGPGQGAGPGHSAGLGRNAEPGQSAGPGGPAAAAAQTLPRDIGSFTGREAELTQLLAAAGDSGLAGICAIDGMAGTGKTTLAVHAAHRLAHGFPDGQFFVPLHAHTPGGQQPVDPADALASLLLTAGVGAALIPPGAEARSARWRDHVAGRKILLVLDDAAGHEQVRPLLPGTAGSLVLITSRRRLTALEDASVLSLDTLTPAEAAALLVRLAGRADLAAEAEATAAIARLCGYLPLAIGMLARQLRHHPARGAADLVTDLDAARDRLAVMRAENLSVAAAFDLSYRDLPTGRQRLFRRLGLAPGPDIDAHAAAALDDVSLDTARAGLDELYDHHLITEPAAGRYLLHDLLRAYARALADGQAEDSAAAGRLVTYYAHAAAAAGARIATWTTAGSRPPPGQRPACLPPLATAEDAAAWLEAERPNLHAAVGFAAEQLPEHAIAIATAMGGFLRARGHWDQAAAQYRTALAAARRAGDRPGQAGALDELGLLQQLTGDAPGAAATLARAAALYQDLGDHAGHAYALNHLGLVHQDTGDYPDAAACHEQALDVAREAGDPLAEAVSLIDLSQVRQLTGDYPAAAAGYLRALPLVREAGSAFDEADVFCELGAVWRLTGDFAAAARDERRALDLFRSLGDRLGQAWALDELGLVQQATGDYEAAAASVAAAAELFRDLGNRPGIAKAHNSLGELATRTSAPGHARSEHGQALAIARELGAAHEEARALEGIGRSFLPGEPAEAAAHLRDALAIYQRLGVPEAQSIRDTLGELGL